MNRGTVYEESFRAGSRAIPFPPLFTVFPQSAKTTLLPLCRSLSLSLIFFFFCLSFAPLKRRRMLRVWEGWLCDLPQSEAPNEAKLTALTDQMQWESLFIRL